MDYSRVTVEFRDSCDVVVNTRQSIGEVRIGTDLAACLSGGASGPPRAMAILAEAVRALSLYEEGSLAETVPFEAAGQYERFVSAACDYIERLEDLDRDDEMVEAGIRRDMLRRPGEQPKPKKKPKTRPAKK